MQGKKWLNRSASSQYPFLSIRKFQQDFVAAQASSRRAKCQLGELAAKEITMWKRM
jgi:hypothetical protein